MNGPPTIDQVVEKIVQLRAEREAIEERHKAELEPIGDKIKRCETWLMAKFNELGLQNVKTPHGTAYKSTLFTAKVEDWTKLLTWIRENDRWMFLNKAVNKTAVQDLVTTSGEIPPGVATDQIVNIRIRKD